MPAKESFVALTSTAYPTAAQVEVDFPSDTWTFTHPGGPAGTPDVAITWSPPNNPAVDEQSLVVGTASQAVSVAIRAKRAWLRLKGAGAVTVQVNVVKEY